MSRVMICPSCGKEVEVKKIRVSERINYKYISFAKAVGVCPECISEIHIPEIDAIVEELQFINKEYVNILSNYQDSSTPASRDTDFSKDWDLIPEYELLFESSKMGIVKRIIYNGTLKNELGYDIITMGFDYNDKLEEIKEIVLNDDNVSHTYYFKTHVMIGGNTREVCCMLWKDIENKVSGIIFNEDDSISYRYGKQKAKEKYVIV